MSSLNFNSIESNSTNDNNEIFSQNLSADGIDSNPILEDNSISKKANESGILGTEGAEETKGGLNNCQETNTSASSTKKKLPSLSLVKEGTDFRGYKVKKVYFSNDSKCYIIFKEANGEIKVFGSGPLSKIEHLLAECKHLTSGIKLDDKTREMFDYQRAIAMNTYILGEVDTSEKILKSLLDKLCQRIVLSKKLCYIGVFLCLTIFMLLLSIVSTQYRLRYETIIKISTFGAIGGFISLNLKLPKIKFKLSESTWSYIIVSIYKVVFSMLTGIISYFLIQSELILSALKNNGTKSLYLMYAIATLAGFSESLLPNFFKNIESSTLKDKSNRKSSSEEEITEESDI